jgi:uncharacterized protein (TIGR03067 family)
MNTYGLLLAAALVPIAAVGSTSPAQRDYQTLSGKWQLTRAYVRGKPAPASQVRRTILITDHNRFWLPRSGALGTHPAGTFTINPGTNPKSVDSTANGAGNAGAVTRGIYEIIDATHQRECWSAPGGSRPRSFTPRTCHLLQYWKKIGPVPNGF